jgi:hypothetical protein
MDIRNWANEMVDWKNQKVNNINVAKELQKLVKNDHVTYCELNSANPPKVKSQIVI